MSERMRCLTTGCNPVLDAESAKAHSESTGHRTAKWPVRSAEGIKKAKARNRNGYYDKYNVGKKSYSSRASSGHVPERSGWGYSPHPFSGEALGEN